MGKDYIFFRLQKYIFSAFTYLFGLFVFPVSFLIFVEDNANRANHLSFCFNNTSYEECDS